MALPLPGVSVTVMSPMAKPLTTLLAVELNVPDDALLLIDAQGSLRAVFSAGEADALHDEAERLARGLPARAALPAQP